MANQFKTTFTNQNLFLLNNFGAHIARNHWLLKSDLKINFGAFICFPSSICLFLFEGFSIYQTKKNASCLKKKIADVTIAPLCIGNWFIFESEQLWLVCLSFTLTDVEIKKFATIYCKLMFTNVWHVQNIM